MDAVTPLIDLAALPLDADAMLAGLRPWVECESPTHDAAAVDRMVDLAACDLAALGATIERIPGRLGYGGSVRATFPHPRAAEPGVLVVGHLDTVHPVGTLALLPFHSDGERAWGPGIQDMKSGCRLSLDAIAALARAGIATPLPVTVLLTPDEEVGTPATRGLIEATARRAKYVLVPEPARADGGVTTGRFAIARFELETRGKPSHAGIDPRLGRSAVREMARRILAIEEMTTDDCTFSVGCVRSAQLHVNCVPSGCSAQALSMARRQADLDAGVARMLALTDESGEVTFTVRRGVTRPVWEPDARTTALFEHARSIGRTLGLELTSASSGGGSDGNFTGAMGIPTLDSLGARGAGLHTLTEHIVIASLPERARLMAGLLATLA